MMKCCVLLSAKMCSHRSKVTPTTSPAAGLGIEPSVARRTTYK